MDDDQNLYWPFEVPSRQLQTEQQWQEIEFLTMAYKAGYKPYMFGSQNFGATAGGRGGIILYRGCRGKHWEIALGTEDSTVLSAHLDNFGCATEAVTLWLGGAEAPEILERFRDNLVVRASTAPGFSLRTDG
jgi:hypothetical protein